MHVIGHGDAFEAGGLRVHCYGEWHAPIYPGVPQVRNTGFLVDGRLFHPGDATLTAVGQQGEDAVFSADPPTGLGTGMPYFRPAPGVPFDF